MPQSGEKNTTFGVFKSKCCGLEIVISVDAEFPTCFHHPTLNTEWVQIEVAPEEVDVLKKQSQSGPAA